jgi:septum formation protein
MRLILASASPRRAELLRAAGFPFDVLPVEVDETFQGGETAQQAVARLAQTKATKAASIHPDAIVLGADTTVVIDQTPLGKPRDDEDARGMLRRLSGRSHEVLTGVCVCRGERCLVHVERTCVRMAAMTDPEIDWYVSTHEPHDKAGAYAVQGLASRFIERIDGSYSNVVGLPIAAVYRLLHNLGCDILGTANSR